MRKLQRAFLFLCILLLSGCPRLPDYALPRAGVPDLKPGSHLSEFTYRELTVHDFRAQSLPAGLSEHADNFRAYSCLLIRPTEETRTIISSGYSPYFNRVVWSGSIRSIGFEAVMQPNSSWWNPKVAERKTAYVLQHEQIHFALMELVARQLTRRVQQGNRDFFVVDSSREGVEKQLKEKISELIQVERDAILEEHTAFDEDTSLYFDPEKQQEWFDRVSGQLQEK